MTQSRLEFMELRARKGHRRHVILSQIDRDEITFDRPAGHFAHLQWSENFIRFDRQKTTVTSSGEVGRRWCSSVKYSINWHDTIGVSKSDVVYVPSFEGPDLRRSDKVTNDTLHAFAIISTQRDRSA